MKMNYNNDSFYRLRKLADSEWRRLSKAERRRWMRPWMRAYWCRQRTAGVPVSRLERLEGVVESGRMPEIAFEVMIIRLREQGKLTDFEKWSPGMVL